MTVDIQQLWNSANQEEKWRIGVLIKALAEKDGVPVDAGLLATVDRFIVEIAICQAELARNIAEVIATGQVTTDEAADLTALLIASGEAVRELTGQKVVRRTSLQQTAGYHSLYN